MTAAIHIQQCKLCVVVWIRILRIIQALDRVRPQHEALLVIHRLFVALIECLPADPDEDQDNPEVNDVPTVPPRIPPRQLHHRCQQILSGLLLDHLAATPELRKDRRDHRRRHRKCDPRIESALLIRRENRPRMHAKRNDRNRHQQPDNPRQDEVLADAPHRRRAPRQQRTDAGEKQ